MGLFDAFKKKEENKADSASGEKKETVEESEEGAGQRGKYDETCSACGKSGTDKKWMGQYWHKKCMRAARKSAKGMI